MATIKEVARLANVSVATVSRVLNKESSVKQETKERVEQSIKALSYSPNLLGRNLRRLETKNILVLLPTLANPFHSGVIKGLKYEGEKLDYQIMIGLTDSEEERAKRAIQMLTNRLVDGVILFSPRLNSELLKQVATRYPIIQCCEYVEGSDTSVVSIDNQEAAYEATKYLISLGHTKIAMLSNKEEYTSAGLREKGFRKALKEYGLENVEGFIQYTEYDYKGGIRACKKLLELPIRPTAIFTIADSMAVGVIKELITRNIKVGEEMDVLGFDNTSIAQMYHPTITTVAQPRFELGQKAMELLLKKIRDIDSPNEVVILPHELMIRESTNNKLI